MHPRPRRNANAAGLRLPCGKEEKPSASTVPEEKKIKGPNFAVAAAYASIITAEGVEGVVLINKTSYLPEPHRESRMSHTALGLSALRLSQGTRETVTSPLA